MLTCYSFCCTLKKRLWNSGTFRDLCGLSRDRWQHWVVFRRYRAQLQLSCRIWGSHGVSTKMAVFWVVAPCSLGVVYQGFRGPCCLHHRPDDGGSKDPRNVDKLVPHYTALQPRRQPSSSCPDWRSSWFSSIPQANSGISPWNTPQSNNFQFRIQIYSIICHSVQSKIAKNQSISISVVLNRCAARPWIEEWLYKIKLKSQIIVNATLSIIEYILVHS
jgi:hypothetical protein